MSIYFDRQLESSCQAAIYIDANWHKSYASFAAASFSKDGHSYVQFYNDEGSVTSKTMLAGRGLPSQIVTLQWHPSRKILAVACKGGELFTWNDYEQELLSSATQHGFAISVLQWTACGSRLISADVNGALVAWKVDSKGKLDLVFRHELKEPVSHVAFRTSKLESNRHAETVDYGGLARAAVGGDENALDLFSASLQVPLDGSTSRRLSQLSGRIENGKGDDLSFYVSLSTGSVYFVEDDGSCVEVLGSSYAPHCLLYHHERGLVVVVNNGPLINQYSSNADGTLDEISNVKLSVKMSDVQVIWAGTDVIALSVGDLTLRFWDLESGDSYNFSLVGRHLRDGLEHITTLAFNVERSVLAAGTNFGNIHMWLHSKETTNEPEKQWLNYSICNAKGSVKQLKWSGFQDNLAVNASACLYMLTAQKTYICLKNQIVAVQLAANQLLLEFLSNGRHLQVSSPDVQIRGIDVTSENLVVWSGHKVCVYEVAVEGKKANQIGCFPCETWLVVISEQTLYTVESGKIQVRTFQGTIKQSLTFLENEGGVTQMDVSGTNLVAATSLNVLKIWEISRREAKPFTSPKRLSEFVTDGGQITSVRCNCNGGKVSLLMSKDKRLIIWDIEGNCFIDYDFGKDTEKSSDVALVNTIPESTSGQEIPISHFWDPQEPRLLVCEISEHRNKRPFKVVSLFVTTEYSILLQDDVPYQPIHASLLGIKVPNYHFLKQSALGDCLQKKGESDEQLPRLVDTVCMRDFAGMENDDVVTRDAMINFGFHLTVGNMDEAFKAIKKIKSGEVWENMARMCVKTKRMDVALVCLGHMGHARGARAVRLAMTEPELDARVAALAIELGMLTEAEQLYQSSHRYDLLNSFYQASGQWEKALNIAQTEDRIHLRTTYYNYAKYLEAKGDILAAISNYEKSETQQFEVPRMLFDELPALEHYVMGTRDKKLLQWWAQYVESTGEMGAAIEYYEKACDCLSLVRVYCYCDNLTKAAEVANESGDRAACYHLGRRYENDGNIREAVHFFERARAYGNAIRICKEHNLEDQLLNLALMGGPNEMIEVARYYESQPDQVERAVMLYQKAGSVTKAAELALKSGRHAALELLANDLDERTEPSVLRRCAEFFVEGGHHSKAVYLLAKAKEYFPAVTLCLEHNVILNEDLVEMLTPSKDEMQPDERGQLLEMVAESCYQQGNYHLATKKFTQAGSKLKAMKALLKSGDTERIVFFANVSRQKEIYVMAANYLQTLDWRQDKVVMKNIVTFYTKAKAPELLAGFYDACAQMEIDEFQNYNKALSALKEAYKCMSAATTLTKGTKTSGGTVEDKLVLLRMKLDLVNKFVEVRSVYEEDPSEAMKMCQSLLDETDLHIGIRPGDVYGFMVEHFAETQNYKMAYNLIEEMRSKLPNANVAFYVDTETLKNIQRNLNLPSNDNGKNIMAYESAIKSNYEGDEDGDDDEIAEDVKDEVY